MSRAWHCLAALLVLLAFALLCDASLYRPTATFTIAENIQIAEAQSWWSGRLDLPERKWDSALFEGKVYSHFPPAFSFLSAIVVPFFDGVPHWFVLMVVVAPIPVLAYWLMSIVASDSNGSASHRRWCALLALGLVCGTSALPVLEKVLRGASPYSVNQAIALSGVLLFLIAYFGNRSFWIAGLGVVVAAWSRQMSVVYLLPLGWMMWERCSKSGSGGSEDSVAPAGAVFAQGDFDQGLRCAPPLATNLGPVRGRRDETVAATTDCGHDQHQSVRSVTVAALFATATLKFCLVAGLAVGVPMGMNWLKFHSPLDSGYMHVYEGRTEDQFARDAREHGLFSTWYVSRNLYYSNLGLPKLHRIERGERPEWYLTPNDWGTGIWWTTPILVFVLAGWRSVASDPKSRMLLLSAGLAYIGLLLYHSTGFEQRGYNRYSLDYLPVLMVLAVPAAMATTGRRWLTAGLVSWSVFYFAVARHWPQMRIW